MAVCSYIGKKEKYIYLIRDIVLQEEYTTLWETHGGTAAITRYFPDVVKNRKEPTRIVTELDYGMYLLLLYIQQKPRELLTLLQEFEYCEETYNWAKEKYKIGRDIERAAATYILCELSYNGSIMSSFRKLKTPSFENLRYNEGLKSRFIRHMPTNIWEGNEELQGVDIQHGDMMDEKYRSYYEDEGMLVVSDVPYINDLDRDSRLYHTDSTLRWHIQYCDMLEQLITEGRLRAKVMIWGNIKDIDNIEAIRGKLYNKRLLKLGFVMKILAHTQSPTIIHDKGAQQRGSNTEILWLYNFESISRNDDDVYDYKRIYGT